MVTKLILLVCCSISVCNYISVILKTGQTRRSGPTYYKTLKFNPHPHKKVVPAQRNTMDHCIRAFSVIAEEQQPQNFSLLLCTPFRPILYLDFLIAKINVALQLTKLCLKKATAAAARSLFLQPVKPRWPCICMYMVMVCHDMFRT